MVKDITKEQLRALLLTARPDDLPILVDFWKEGCAPCKVMAGVLDMIAEDYAAKLVCFKYDIGTQGAPEGVRVDVTAVPAFALFKGGRMTAKFVGAQPPQKVRALLAMNGVQ